MPGLLLKLAPAKSSNKSVLQKMKKVSKIVFTIFKAINYGRGETNQNGEGDEQSRSRSRDSNRRPPSAPTRKPPTIRIRRDASLNGMVWGSPQQLTTSDSANTTIEAAPPAPRRSRKRHNSKIRSQPLASQNGTVSDPITMPHLDSGNHLKVQEHISAAQHRSLSRESRKRSVSRESREENYSPEAERFVRAAIDRSRPIERQVIRIINGNEPTIQSQVLLNTKTSQPWDDLVADLGMAVKLPRRGTCHMETISGQKIQSYSLLRSELLAGNHAFYVYTSREEFPELGIAIVPSRSPRSRKASRASSPPGLHHRASPLPNINIQKELGKPSAMSHARSTGHLGNLNETGRKSSMKPGKTSAVSNPTLRTNNNQLAPANSNDRLTLMSSRSNPNLTARLSPSNLSVDQSAQTILQAVNVAHGRKRSTRRRRSQNSSYLVTAHRSRSVSP
ncbi:unnamed protein product [Allacma fusca]|uniref:Doublecortin domain-containing protein n=1 Tax=Allacma fusca TaxID=39272 RepID=A0A8J2L914_9HEXA|nr:unnamed protein product [Allacma fusca]